jgi:hypothetical protein
LKREIELPLLLDPVLARLQALANERTEGGTAQLNRGCDACNR